MSKTHYRKVMKSDHLGIADLEDLIDAKKSLVFTIKEVKQQLGVSVAGKKIDANIAYFVEPIKPLVLNATNSKQVSRFSGSPFVEDWTNIMIELYIEETVRMKGEVVGGVRISPIKPIPKQKPIFTKDLFEGAKNANATIEMIKGKYVIDLETEKQYLEYVK